MEFRYLRNVWANYFPDRIDKTATKKYIMYNSLFRPRDIIRLLKLAQASSGAETTIPEASFIDARKEFSSQMWIEITEELQAIYSSAEIGLIRRSLTNFRRQFYIQDFTRRVTEIAQTDAGGRKLVQRRGPLAIAEDLYRIGVIGNEYEIRGRTSMRRNRWIFRGDDFMLEEERLAIHRSLWNYLSIPSRD